MGVKLIRSGRIELATVGTCGISRDDARYRSPALEIVLARAEWGNKFRRIGEAFFHPARKVTFTNLLVSAFSDETLWIYLYDKGGCVLEFFNFTSLIEKKDMVKA